MYEQLFKYRVTIARYRREPLAAEREAYLKKLEADGYSRRRLIQLARQLLAVSRTVKKLPTGITPGDIAQAAKRWAARPGCVELISERRFVALVTKWCQALGVLGKQPSPIAKLAEDYISFLESVRGLAPKTIVHHKWYATDFLKWIATLEGSNLLVTVTAEQVDQYFSNRCSQGWSRQSAGCAARVLRSFFQYAYEARLCSLPIAPSIQSPRIYEFENLPAGPSWTDVIRLVEQMDIDRKVDVRDKAIIMLCAVYGFRSSEVCQLKLDDLDWEHERIRVWRPKQNRRQEYPLVPVVGEAIIQYLQHVRPSSRRREVFLLLSAPFGALSAAVIYEIVRKRYAKLGIVSRKQGPHSLRHASAARLIDRGFSLKEVGDHLGHRSLSVTGVYAKVNVRSLREVAKIVEEGVL